MESAEPGRSKLTDLIAAEGLPSEGYEHAVTTISQSLAKYNFAIIELPAGDEVLVKCVLESARMFFHQRPLPLPVAGGVQHRKKAEPVEWNGSSGYSFDPHSACEVYGFRPGHASSQVQTAGDRFPPVALPELFSFLGRVSRHVLEAIGRSLGLQSFCYADLLDNVPLKHGETSTSVLSVCCHGRPGVHVGAANGSSSRDADPLTGRGLLTLMKSDIPGLHVRDVQGRWLLADADLGPRDMIVYGGLALYQCTAGFISPASHCTNVEVLHSKDHVHGRCSVSYRLMPRAQAVLQCSAMVAAGHGLPEPFRQPILVRDFMKQNFPADHGDIGSRPGFPNHGYQPLDGSRKAVMKCRKQSSKVKPLAPSKRLRSEAQRVLKEKVQEIADSKGIKIRFCCLKDCEELHIARQESPCAGIRAKLGWPAGVPFVHPHDLPNKAKQAFLEAYESGLTSSQAEDMGTVGSRVLHVTTHVCEPPYHQGEK